VVQAGRNMELLLNAGRDEEMNRKLAALVNMDEEGKKSMQSVIRSQTISGVVQWTGPIIAPRRGVNDRQMHHHQPARNARTGSRVKRRQRI
jgi:hypothetical protein